MLDKKGCSPFNFKTQSERVTSNPILEEAGGRLAERFWPAADGGDAERLGPGHATVKRGLGIAYNYRV